MSDERENGRLLCVEDDPLMARGIARVLRSSIVDHASSIAEAETLLGTRSYAGILVDIRLGDGSGIELLRHVRSTGFLSPALIMTGADPLPHINEAQTLGAEFITKPCPAACFLAFEARCIAMPPLARVVLAHVEQRAREWALSRRERDVLAAAARGVARAAIPLELELAEGSVRTYVTRLLAKADLASLEEAVRMVLQSD